MTTTNARTLQRTRRVRGSGSSSKERRQPRVELQASCSQDRGDYVNNLSKARHVNHSHIILDQSPWLIDDVPQQVLAILVLFMMKTSRRESPLSYASSVYAHAQSRVPHLCLEKGSSLLEKSGRVVFRAAK
eukprot:6171963-Pleurochrysis_carterae.AAC.1